MDQDRLVSGQTARADRDRDRDRSGPARETDGLSRSKSQLDSGSFAVIEPGYMSRQIWNLRADKFNT